MSEIKVNKLSPRTGTNVTLGDSGDTFTIPSGATITNNGTQTGFGRTGSVDWQTTPKTSTFTAVSGEGYFINSGSAITMNLPAGTAGAIVAISDYARNFGTYTFTISANGSEKIGGVTNDAKLSTNGQSATLVYVDSTKGWVNTQNAQDTFIGAVPYNADFLVIAGGGGGGAAYGGGGGAGGYRNSYASETSGGGGSTESDISLSTGAVYTITVGDGGAKAVNGNGNVGTQGGTSSIVGSGVNITTVGGGGGGGGAGSSTAANGQVGGSGGGGGSNSNGSYTAGGAGTTNQGYAGGTGRTGSGYGGGGGGGAGAVGANYSSGPGNGGNGLASSITGSSVTRGGGGGAGSWTGEGSRSSGGSGGGGAGNQNTGAADNGTANTGGGGGGAGTSAGDGGSGVVILRVPTANYSGTTTGSPTVSTNGSDTIMIFNASGSYTA